MGRIDRPRQRAIEAILAMLHDARGKEPFPVNFDTLEAAGLVSAGSTGLPVAFVRLALSRDCLVWGPHRSTDGKLCCFVQGRCE